MKDTIKQTTRLLLQGKLTKEEADQILLDLHIVSGSVVMVEGASGQGYSGGFKGIYHELTDKLKEDAQAKWWICKEVKVEHYR